MSDKPVTVGAVLYPAFELLDLFGPLEMYSALGSERIQIHMVAEQAGPVSSSMGVDGPLGPKAMADFSFDDVPALDILLVPGGVGTIPELENEKLLDFLRSRSRQAQIVSSVCTGSALLARAGVLDGRRATSNKQVFALAVGQSDQVKWVEQARWVEDGKFFTSSGVSAGMDMTLSVIEQQFGVEAADTVCHFTEYTRHLDSSVDPFADDLNAMAQAMGLA